MSSSDEVALLKYLLQAGGEKEAVDAAKACDPDIFSTFAVREALTSFRHHMSRGVWPSLDLVCNGMETSTVSALKIALEGAENVFSPISSLDGIRRDWEKARSLETLSRGFHGLQNGTCTLNEILHELQTNLVKTDGWEERDFVDVLRDISEGQALGTYSTRNLMVTGIESIDKALASPPGSYGVIGAMPGVGKTSLMFQIGTLSAMSGTKVHAMSLETPKATLEAKSAATFFAANGYNAFVNTMLKTGKFMPSASLSESFQRDQFKIGFHPAGLSWDALEAKISRMADRGTEMFLIDYFSLLEPPDIKNKSEHSKSAEMSKAVKALCAKLQVQITFVVQPNAEGKYGERPDPSQLATSKQVFRDYDFGLYMWQDKSKAEDYQKNNGNHLKLLKAWLHKNRLFSSDDHTIKSEPEVWVEAELRRNWFKEIPEPASGPSGMGEANLSRGRL